jgi:hypothetical protein
MPIKNLKEKLKNLQQNGVKIIRTKRGKTVTQEEEDEYSKWEEFTIEKLKNGGEFKAIDTEPVLRVAYSKLNAYGMEPEVAARVICAIYLAVKEEI